MAAQIASVTPNWAQCDDADLTIDVWGSGFVPGVTKVNWNGADDATTTFVSTSHLQLLIRPSTAFRPSYIPVSVTGDTNKCLFQFTPGPTPGGPKSWYPPVP